MHTRPGSVEVWWLNGSLVLRFMACCLAIVCFRSLRQVPVSPCQPDRSVRIQQQSSSRLRTVTVYFACGTMVSGDTGDSRPKDDHSGVNFCA